MGAILCNSMIIEMCEDMLEMHAILSELIYC